jgi:hypothetical protein
MIETVALFLGYILLYLLIGSVVYFLLNIHWRMFICVINKVKLVKHTKGAVLTEKWRKKKFVKTQVFFYGLIKLWTMPWDCDRVSYNIDGVGMCEYFPGLWSNCRINGVKV